MVESEMISVIVSWTVVNIRGCNLEFLECGSKFAVIPLAGRLGGHLNLGLTRGEGAVYCLPIWI